MTLSKLDIRKFFLGFIRIHVLYHASKEPVYGLWLIEELARQGYKLSPGTLYPVLHSLEAEGHLRSKKELHGGKIRKYYKITAKGARMLAESKERISALVKEVLE